MASIALQHRDLPDIARTYGKVYKTAVGEVSYTKLIDPQGFVLLAKDDQLRFYLLRKPGGVWELVWGASSIVHEGLPQAEELIQWRLKQAMRSGKQGFDEAETLGKSMLDAAASVGTGVHEACEKLLSGKEVVLAGRGQAEISHIVSLANFINDHDIHKSRNEMIVVYDKTTTDGVRIVYAGTTDWVVEIYNKLSKKWETWLIDFKTSADAYLSHKLQALGYKEAAEASYGIKIDRVGILLLGRKTIRGYNLVEVGVERKYRLTFKDFVLAYRMLLLLHKGSLPAPSYKTYPKSIKLIQEKEKEDGKNNINSVAGAGDGGVIAVVAKAARDRVSASRVSGDEKTKLVSGNRASRIATSRPISPDNSVRAKKRTNSRDTKKG